MVSNNEDSQNRVIQVLHVDDDEDHFIILKRQVEKFDPQINMNFISAPYDALELLESFDCLILDYKMPKFDEYNSHSQYEKQAISPSLYTQDKAAGMLHPPLLSQVLMNIS